MKFKRLMLTTALASALSTAAMANAFAEDHAKAGQAELTAASLKGNKTAKSVAASKSPAEESAVGTIIKKEKVETGSLIAAPKGAETYRVTYAARNAHGDPILETGLVTIPKGKAPEGGWPVLSWAHGTMGLAMECAPSLAKKGNPDHKALEMVAQKYLQTWLDKGFAVIQPDYEGLGTVGYGTYMDRHSLASSVNELVRAARKAFSFSDKWYNTGWSQGGFAAVAAASADDVPDGLQETLAIAPGDTVVPEGDEALEHFEKLMKKLPTENVAYMAYSLRGAMNYRTDFKPDDFLSEDGKKVLAESEQKCLTDLKDDNKVPASKLLNNKPNIDGFTKVMNENSMINMKTKSPVILFISKDDDIINYEQISTSAKKLAENNGDNIKIVEHSGESHYDMVRRAIKDQKEYVKALQ